MTATRPRLTGRESPFHRDEIIVSKTDLNGLIRYANQVFLRVSGFAEQEILGKPHNIIRHPDMPRCVFRLLWETVRAGDEIFAYVLNRAKNGDHYWVLAHVTPTVDPAGRITGYHSNRRAPAKGAIDRVVPLYKTLIAAESAGGEAGVRAGYKALTDTLADAGASYPEFVWSVIAAEEQL